MKVIPFSTTAQQGAYISEDRKFAISYGYFWSPCNTGAAFSRNATNTPVTVYLRTETWVDGTPYVKEVFRQVLRSARYKRDADKIGRQGIREVLRPLIDEELAKATQG